VVLVGLGLVSVGAFALVPAAQIGVTESSDTDRGLASAVYFSTYYTCAALGAYLPGIAWERSGWSGVVAVGALALAVPLVVLAAQVTRAYRFSGT
jgi:YNFM family putative membrane transporter